MILSGDARFAERSFVQTNTAKQPHAHDPAQTGFDIGYVRVKGIRKGKIEPVYNMEVERHHNFSVQGGLIVHNCVDSARYAIETEIGRKVAKTRSDIY